ncbi:MAG TPA: hypothetical protein VMF65_22970 [Acidimicrobiales bacterium]|nr:hypothetical protein [Acidimicrobiales bacterium]
MDLTIALEVLLVNPTQPTTEIRFKFKVRGSLLASSVPHEHKSVTQLLERLYSLRSKAAHGSVFDVRDRSIEI